MNLKSDLIYVITDALVKALGLYPHDKSRLVSLQRVLIILLTVPHICLQYSVFFTTQYSITLFIRVASLACPSSLITMMYVFFTFKLQTISNLDDQLKADWRMLRNKIENDILQTNAYENQLYFIMLLGYAGSIIVLTIGIQFFPAILDLILPLDEARQRDLFILVEYFVTQNKYSYTTVLHEIVFVVVIVTVFYANTAQILQFVFHIHGMLKIARYRIQCSIENSVSHVSQSNQNRAICKGVMHAVNAHRRAMEFCDIIVSTFNETFCCILLFSVMSMSINLYGIIEGIMVSKNVENVLLCSSISLGVSSYLLLVMHLLQKVHDYNNELFTMIYNSSWYLLPVSMQKLILFLLQRGGKDHYLKFGFIFEGKLENIAVLMNASLSYVCMMYNCAYS